MKYSYKCADCKSERILNRSIDDRNLPTSCECGGEAKRVFSAAFQICTDRISDKPENKYALGFDESTRTATRKADDAKYEANWAGSSPSKPKAPEPLIETYQKFGGKL